MPLDSGVSSAHPRRRTAVEIRTKRTMLMHRTSSTSAYLRPRRSRRLRCRPSSFDRPTGSAAIPVSPLAGRSPPSPERWRPLGEWPRKRSAARRWRFVLRRHGDAPRRGYVAGNTGPHRLLPLASSGLARFLPNPGASIRGLPEAHRGEHQNSSQNDFDRSHGFLPNKGLLLRGSSELGPIRLHALRNRDRPRQKTAQRCELRRRIDGEERRGGHSATPPLRTREGLARLSKWSGPPSPA